MYLLQRSFCVRTVKTRGTRRGDQGMRAGVQLDVDQQFIATDQSGRRMHQNVVTHLVALRVKAFQNTQRPLVLMADHATLVFNTVVKLELGLPTHTILYSKSLNPTADSKRLTPKAVRGESQALFIFF